MYKDESKPKKKSENIDDLLNQRAEFEKLRNNFPRWMEKRILNKKAQRFISVLSEVMGISVSCEAEENRVLFLTHPPRGPLTDIERLNIFYNTMARDENILRFIELEKAADALLKDKRFIVSAANRKSFIEITGLAKAVPMQVLTRSGMICQEMIKNNDTNKEAAKKISETCQKAVDNFQNVKGVFEEAVVDKKAKKRSMFNSNAQKFFGELLVQHEHVFVELTSALKRIPKPTGDERKALVDDVNTLINRYRQKLFFYLSAKNAANIDYRSLDSLLSKLNTLLAIAKMFDSESISNSVQGVIVVLKSFAGASVEANFEGLSTDERIMKKDMLYKVEAEKMMFGNNLPPNASPAEKEKRAAAIANTELSAGLERADVCIKKLQEMFPLSAQAKEEIEMHLKEAKTVQTMARDDVKRYSEELLKKRRGSSSASISSDEESSPSKTDSSDDKQSKMAELERERQELAEARRRSDEVMKGIHEKELAEAQRQAAEARSKARSALQKPPVPSRVAGVVPASAVSPTTRRPMPPPPPGAAAAKAPKPRENTAEPKQGPSRATAVRKISRGQ